MFVAIQELRSSHWIDHHLLPVEGARCSRQRRKRGMSSISYESFSISSENCFASRIFLFAFQFSKRRFTMDLTELFDRRLDNSVGRKGCSIVLVKTQTVSNGVLRDSRQRSNEVM